MTSDNEADNNEADNNETGRGQAPLTRAKLLSRRQIIALAILIPTVLAAGYLTATSLFDVESTLKLTQIVTDDEFDYEYVIPPGTAERIAAGEPIEIIPRQLNVQVGESIRIVNNDDANHDVGLFYVAAGQTLTQSFTAPGTLEGACTIHPSGQFTLNISDT